MASSLQRRPSLEGWLPLEDARYTQRSCLALQQSSITFHYWIFKSDDPRPGYLSLLSIT